MATPSNTLPHPNDHINLALRLAYKGTAYTGFARQKSQVTVQGELEEALSKLYGQPVQTVCAGRTDAGVHALGQVVSFEADQSLPPARLQAALNAQLPADISCLAARIVAPGFSARFSARQRTYKYFLYPSLAKPVFMADFCWHLRMRPRELDLASMRAAAAYLVGEHDFKSFCVAKSALGRPTNRCVNALSLRRQTIMGEPLVVLTISGNAFLHSMVRTIVGSLVRVGKGQRPIGWIPEVLAAHDRAAAGETAPARGLVLWQVDY